MIRVTTVLYGIIATAFIWAGVALARLIGGANADIFNFALVAGIGSTVAIWLVWVFIGFDQSTKIDANLSKSKRAPEDARLSLLLQLMDEDERNRLKQRLREDLGADGEAVALDDLLGQSERARRK